MGDFKALESQTRWKFWPDKLLQADWSSPRTNRLLLEAGFSATLQPYPARREQTHGQLGIRREPERRVDYRVVDRVSLQRRHLVLGPATTPNRYVERFSVSYVTGSHAFKTGFQLQQGINSGPTPRSIRICNYGFLHGVPNTITQLATPYTTSQQNESDLGVFAQDRWTINRLAINMGLRFDYFNGYVPAQQIPATPSGWIPERNFAKVTRMPDWTDLNPRVGASYDLFGNGRTAREGVARPICRPA